MLKREFTNHYLKGWNSSKIIPERTQHPLEYIIKSSIETLVDTGFLAFLGGIEMRH